MIELITTKELESILKVNRQTITTLRKKGLPFLKLDKTIRFNLDDVMQWIKENSK